MVLGQPLQGNLVEPPQDLVPQIGGRSAQIHPGSAGLVLGLEPLESRGQEGFRFQDVGAESRHGLPLSLRERAGVRGIDKGRTILGAAQPAWPPGLTELRPLAPAATPRIAITGGRRDLDATCQWCSKKYRGSPSLALTTDWVVNGFTIL